MSPISSSLTIRRSLGSSPLATRPNSRFCRTVIQGKMDSSWRTYPRCQPGPSNRTLRGAEEAGEDPEQSGLSATDRTEQGDELAVLDLQTQPIQRLGGGRAGVAIAKVHSLQDRRRGAGRHAARSIQRVPQA